MAWNSAEMEVSVALAYTIKVMEGGIMGPRIDAMEAVAAAKESL